MENSTPYKIVTPEYFILKVCARDYVGEITYHANFVFNLYFCSQYSGGFLPNK